MGSKLGDRRRRHDRYYRAAKDVRYAARSVFKLEEIDKRFRLFRSGQRVLDLGCRPGSWMQYVANRIGQSGLVVGLDRQPLDIDLAPNMRTLVGNVLEMDPNELRGDVSCFHWVLSDMAPDTTGVPFADQARSIELFMRAFELAQQLGCPNGGFVAKVFMGEGFQQALTTVRRAYPQTKAVRPDATRRESTEVYVVARPGSPRGQKRRSQARSPTRSDDCN